MTDYNLTFHEAIAAAVDGNIIANDFFPNLIYRFYNKIWEYCSLADKEKYWDITSFYQNEISANWKIAESEKEKMDESKDYLNSLEERIETFEKAICSMGSRLEAHINLICAVFNKIEDKQKDLEEKVRLLIKSNYKDFANTFVDEIPVDDNLKEAIRKRVKSSDEKYGGTE